jgi:hypothetical protein
VAIGLLVLVGFTGFALRIGRRGGAAGAPIPETSPAALAMTSAASGCPSGPAAPLRGDLDGDGCDEALSYADGIVTDGRTRLRIGEGTDQVATGRWTCGAASTLALLRSDGDVYVFPSWAAAGIDVPARLVGHVEGGTGLAAADTDGDGCDEIVIASAGGATATVDPRSSA